MNLGVIYEPKGAAREYAPLALNIYRGCTHRCAYCYAPGSCRMAKDFYFSSANPKDDIISRVESDAKKLSDAGDRRTILLSFIGDPYQPAEGDLRLTRLVIRTLMRYGLEFSILTKGARLAMDRDFELLQDYPWVRFGVTLSLHKTSSLARWEPCCDSVLERLEALRVAHDFGIKTWMSVEPVIYPDEALDIILFSMDFIDHYKIGKINHCHESEETDWIKFRTHAVNLLSEWEKDFYIKKSLSEFESQ